VNVSLPLTPNTVRVTIDGTLPGGRPWINGWWASLSDATALTQANADTFAAALVDAYTDLLPAQHTSFQCTKVTVTDTRSLGGPQFFCTTGFPLVGSNANPPLPEQCCALVSWKTSFRGKAGRGRTFLPGFTEDASAGGGPTGAVITILNEFRDDIVGSNTFAVESLFLGTVVATTGSRRKKPVQRVTGVQHLITGGSVSPLWSTQRRRLRG
jgi:hypothetical protein